MIPRSHSSLQATWQQQLKQSAISASELVERLQLPVEMIGQLEKASSGFPLRVPDNFLQRIQPGNLSDPLLKQVLPDLAELEHFPGFSNDPLDEQHQSTPSGLLHKYPSRVLLVVTGACPVHCRYCFRRHFPYQQQQMGKQGIEKCLKYIEQHPEINEVILSGGDPLSAPDRLLSDISSRLDQIPHLKRLRIHSRFPVMIPDRINDSLLQWIGHSRLKPVMVLHINHANEINQDLTDACERLKRAGVLLLNQTVLLKGVNDSSEQLCQLSETLFNVSVQPYYLHLLDKVAGAGHFEVSQTNAINLMHQLLEKLPGFLVPKLVREVAGVTSKLPIDLNL
ncbi:EF-P beta-lysylation protein EpmB [Pelagibaculum spongiae]|uniref:L-lysine 2,3-aminomutase n=1 Tax=Pelagibaculum spongiae TaxID=2080658 RepID=A0A2V1GWV1_9GAMM|nr:EF-P beta-lysylation protein EpmB [Pelagibaculum spongiae]PVZ65676.1 EF-P beta-lysylation protein EpmB [Pelagibaculum spongiae]